VVGSYVWYNGVDTCVFNCDGGKARTDEFEIGCVGNFNPCKRQIDLIKAFEFVLKDLPNVKLKLVGDGKTYNECVEYVNAHGMKNSVEFIAPMSRDRLADFYRSIDLLVTPSVNEGFCCVNAESNYCGAPFIAVKGLPMEEVLDASEYDRWLVAPYDVEGLAKKIVEFAKDSQKQKLSVDLDANNLARQFNDWIIAKRERSNA
jgi:glycosyltransferase involved in cell wall biosynthesis